MYILVPAHSCNHQSVELEPKGAFLQNNLVSSSKLVKLKSAWGGPLSFAAVIPLALSQAFFLSPLLKIKANKYQIPATPVKKENKEDS